MLITQIKQDVKQAMRDKDKAKLSTLRMLIATIEKKQIETKGILTDLEVIESISKNIKQLNQEIESIVTANRDNASEKIAKLDSEKEVLLSYLPKQLSEEEIRTHVTHALELISKGEIASPMQYLSTKLKGKADMKLVNKLVKEGMSK